jgi:hypothetical protein
VRHGSERKQGFFVSGKSLGLVGQILTPNSRYLTSKDSFTGVSPLFSKSFCHHPYFQIKLYDVFSEMTKLEQTENKRLIIKRLTHIQNLAKKKKFAEIEALINDRYV